MKKIILSIVTSMLTHVLAAQQTYCDFDGIKVLSFGDATGAIDSLFVNPAPDSINSSAYCARYIRSDTASYDNFKLNLDTIVEDVTLYAISGSLAPKISLKLYSTAPVGTIIHIQLGQRNDNNYPSGTHSEYMAATTVQNGWENLEFNFFQSTSGSLVSPTEINKVVILLNPGSIVVDTIYFDDLMGPELLINTTSIADVAAVNPLKLFQNTPNPAKENTRIDFELSTAGMVSLELIDLLGKPVSSLLNKNLNVGIHSVSFDTSTIPGGTYFYVLKNEGNVICRKMIISK